MELNLPHIGQNTFELPPASRSGNANRIGRGRLLSLRLHGKEENVGRDAHNACECDSGKDFRKLTLINPEKTLA